MKDTVEIEIAAPQAEVAALFSDPDLSPEWMEDLERYEPLVGEPGMPGSSYRLVSKSGRMDFTGRILAKHLPNESRVLLDGDKVRVLVTGRFVKRTRERTLLVSEEVFTFKGAMGKVFGFVAKPGIHKAHRKQMEAFKRYAERKSDA